MGKRILWKSAVFIIAFVLLRAIGELALQQQGLRSVGLGASVLLAGQHAFLVVLLAILGSHRLGDRAFRILPIASLSLILFLAMRYFGGSTEVGSNGPTVELVLDAGYVVLLTVLSVVSMSFFVSERADKTAVPSESVHVVEQ